jgi:hypothetical protein
MCRRKITFNECPHKSSLLTTVRMFYWPEQHNCICAHIVSKRRHCWHQIKVIGKKAQSNNYRNFHHSYDANTEHNKDLEARLACIVNVDRKSVGNSQKQNHIISWQCWEYIYIGHQCSCSLWYNIAVWPSTSSTKLPWRKLQSHL